MVEDRILVVLFERNIVGRVMRARDLKYSPSVKRYPVPLLVFLLSSMQILGSVIKGYLYTGSQRFPGSARKISLAFLVGGVWVHFLMIHLCLLLSHRSGA